MIENFPSFINKSKGLSKLTNVSERLKKIKIRTIQIV